GKPADPRKPATADLIDFKVELAPASVRRGETAHLTITGVPHKGYHTYPITHLGVITQPVEWSKIVFESTAGLKPLYPVRESEPKEEALGLGGVPVYEKEFTWTQDLFVPKDLTPGDKVLRFRIHLQVCDASRCTSGDHHFEVPLTVVDAPAVAAPPP